MQINNEQSVLSHQKAKKKNKMRMFFYTKTRFVWLKILNIIIEFLGWVFVRRCWCSALFLSKREWKRMEQQKHIDISECLFRSFLFCFVFSFHSHSHFSFGCMCVLNSLIHSRIYRNTITYTRKIKRSCWQLKFKAYSSNKWSRTNKKEWANAQQKHPIQSFLSYACQMPNAKWHWTRWTRLTRTHRELVEGERIWRGMSKMVLQRKGLKCAERGMKECLCVFWHMGVR